MIALDLDREVGAHIAVDIALDDGEVTIGAGLEGHGELSCGGKFRARDKREGIAGNRAGVGIDRAEIDPVTRSEPVNGVAVGTGRCRELEGVVTGTAVHDVGGIARHDGIVARAGIDVLDSPKGIVAGLSTARAALGEWPAAQIDEGVDRGRRDIERIPAAAAVAVIAET